MFPSHDQDGKSIMHMWDDEKDRSKFWTSRVTRLLMALGRMNHDTDGLNIWIRSYGRVFHIDYFVRPPQGEHVLRLIPDKLYRLEK